MDRRCRASFPLREFADRAGGAIQTIMSDRLEAMIGEIAARGIHYVDEENPGPGVRKVMYNDPDGNEIGLGQIPSQ